MPSAKCARQALGGSDEAHGLGVFFDEWDGTQQGGEWIFPPV